VKNNYQMHIILCEFERMMAEIILKKKVSLFLTRNILEFEYSEEFVDFTRIFFYFSVDAF